MEIKIKNEKPPVYDAVTKAFGKEPITAIFTYGDTIYNPQKFPLPDHIIEHEKVHMPQQLNYPGGPDAWWERYLRDTEFRVDQEARAYARQYDFCCQQGINRQQKRALLKGLAKILSGQLYDKAIPLDQAKELILKFSYMAT